MVSIMPFANALTARTDFSDRHTTASWGNSKICGDHVCGPGEKTQWAEKMAEMQRNSYGKVSGSSTYHDVMKTIQSNSNSGKTSDSLKMTEKIHVGENMTSMNNMTRVK